MKKWMKKIFIGTASLIVIFTIVFAVLIYFKFFSSLEKDRTALQPLLFYNGNIITVEPSSPEVEAVFVEGDTIIFAGRYEDAKKFISNDTKLIDLKGKTLIPGFNDNHTHSLAAGTFYSELMLWNKSCDEISDMIKDEAKGKKPGEEIYGNLWDYTSCRNPHKAILDKAAPDNPVFLTQFSGHAAWVNSYKLKQMGLDKNTPDPAGGEIVRDPKGEPTGVLRDTAMGSSQDEKFIKLLFNSEKHKKVMDRILNLYREAGICSVQDNTWEPFTVRFLQEYSAKGDLTCRFDTWAQGGTYLFDIFNTLTSFDENDEWVRNGPVKYFADGAFSTRTAWMNEPFNNEPDNYGKPRHTTKELEEIVMKSAENRQRIIFHAIGDRAVHELLNAIEKAQVKYPWTKDLRFRFEHVQMIESRDIPRMKALGIVACIQPFSMSLPEKDIDILGLKRAEKAYPFYDIFKAGIPVSFGSDVPAEVDFNPLLGIYYAITGKSKNGKEGPLNRNKKFSAYEALYCYTMGSAYAQFMENRKGSITPGKLADLVILSDDLTSVKRESVKDIKVIMTIVGGKIVYEKGL